MTTDYAISGDCGEQLGLGGMLPAVGDQYRNRNTGSIGTVVHVESRHKTWVTVRYSDREREVELSVFEEYWQRFTGTAV